MHRELEESMTRETINKKMEINSYILTELRTQGAPMWVRPQMLFDPKWLDDRYSVEEAEKEAREKVKLFVPLCAEHITDDFRRVV